MILMHNNISLNKDLISPRKVISRSSEFSLVLKNYLIFSDVDAGPLNDT